MPSHIEPSHPPTILLTGFGPFPGVPSNVSGRLVKALARRARVAFPCHHVVCAVFRTEWRNAPVRVSALIAAHRPVLALHFGVASGSQTLRIERQAANACRCAPDAAGLPPVAPLLFADGEAFRAVSIPVDAVYQRLAARNLPVSISDDAGGYLCNAVLYHALAHEVDRQGPGRVGFIHLPGDLSSPPLTFSVALDASLEIIDACLGADGA